MNNKFELIIERLSDGEEVQITSNQAMYQLLSVDGIEVPEIDMATYDIASVDGSVLSNIRMPDREITISIVIRGDVEANRRKLHQICRVRSLMRLHFQVRKKLRYIDGYLKAITSNRFDTPSFTFDMTFTCPDPYFKDENHVIVDMSRTYGTFVFPFGMGWRNAEGQSIGMRKPMGVTDLLRTANINSVSENETGIIIRVVFRESASSLRITNADTGDWFELHHAFQSGDTVEINTINGQKDVQLTRGHETSTIIADIVDGSSFFQLQSGDNRFNYVLDGQLEKTGATMEFDFTPIYLAL